MYLEQALAVELIHVDPPTQRKIGVPADSPLATEAAMTAPGPPDAPPSVPPVRHGHGGGAGWGMGLLLLLLLGLAAGATWAALKWRWLLDRTSGLLAEAGDRPESWLEMTEGATGRVFYLNTVTGQTSPHPPAPTRARGASSVRTSMRRMTRQLSVRFQQHPGGPPAGAASAEAKQ